MEIKQDKEHSFDTMADYLWFYSIADQNADKQEKYYMVGLEMAKNVTMQVAGAIPQQYKL